MGAEHKDDLVARVLAWHRHHPFARRLRPEQVQSIGWVVLPFVAADVAKGGPEGSGGRGAGASTGAAGPWQPAFRETVVDGYPARRLLRWVRRHGVPARPADDGLPVREAVCDRGRAPAGVPIERLWLRTALIDVDGARRRLLLAADGQALLGQRLWSQPRLALAIAVPIVASVVIVFTTAHPWPTPGGTAMALTPLPEAPAAPAATAEPAAAPASLEPAAAAAPAPIEPVALPVVAAASATLAGPALPASAPGGSASASRPHALHEPIEPLMQAGRRPTVLTPLDEAAKAAAREAVAAARAQRPARSAQSGRPDPPAPTAGAKAPVASVPPVLPTPAAAAPPAVAPATGAPVWAVSTRALRTRFESEQMLLALRDAARHAGAAGATALHFEVLPVGADWRAVSWPFAEREAAERLRAELHARGVRVEVVAF